MGDVLFSALRDIDRVAKKQRTCSAKTMEYLDQMVKDIEHTRELVKLCESPLEKKALMKQLHEKLTTMGISKQIAAQQKELYGSVSRLGKVVDKHFNSPVFSNQEANFDESLINEVVANHLLREGKSDIGKVFCEEAGIRVPEQLQDSFLEMHKIIKELKIRNLKPALDWVQKHKLELSEQNRATSLEFKLHSMHFIHLLCVEGSKVALEYMREHLSKFSDTHMADIRQLMGCMMYCNSISTSPYQKLLTESHWEDVEEEFMRECCNLMGQPCESPLLVATAAGALAIPTLTKFATVVGNKQEWAAMDQLPVEIELGPEFTFYSIFACPISRDQSSPDDPPMMLPCGHVLSKQSVTKLSKNNSKPFKCPYCPSEAHTSQCMQLTF